MSPPVDPVLDAVTRSAVEATGAARGWLLRATASGDLEVVAASGAGVEKLVGATVAGGSGCAGYVVASGQPLAVAVRPDDARFAEGVAARAGVVPASVLCVPCAGDDNLGENIVAGALELTDKAGGGTFSVDDVEIATLLAGIAGAALNAIATPRPDVPEPAALAAALARLSAADPSRYASVAAIVSLLADV